MKDIPGFDIELAQATDYILGSPLAKKAFIQPPFCYFTNIVTEIIQWIDRLADNCHMPEFTNHALPHICSIVKRASEWGESDGWLNKISSQEAGYLLIALLIHDIGMLSQDEQDVPEKERLQHMKGLSDVSGWVRRTHVIRIEKLIKYLLRDYLDAEDLKEELSVHLDIIIGMAQSHARWPWDSDFVTKKPQIMIAGLKEERIGALNAVIAVCDLLDEDADRCDTLTLIKHRYGTIENKAHWIRHAITKHVDGVKNHRIVVRFRRLPSESPYLEMLYRTLRNHYRLVKLYQEKLTEIQAEIQHLDFEPGDGIPEEEDEISRKLNCYHEMPEFQFDLIPHLMATFMKEARNQDGGNRELRRRLDEIGLETMDLSGLDTFFHPKSLLYPEERVFFGEGTIEEKLKYAYDLAEKAYVNGEIEKLRHICGAVFKMMKPHSVKAEQIYWALAYLLIYEKGSIDFDAAERMHQNPLFLNIRSGHKDVPEVNAPERPYQGLLDVLLCFLKPYITSDALKLYQEYLMLYDYGNLKDDFATMQLVRTVVDLFWFWDRESEAWHKIAEHIRQQAKEGSQVKDMLKVQQKCLNLQDKILYGSEEISEEELAGTDYPVLARAWKHFFGADWEGMEKDIQQMIDYAEKNPDFFSAVQGFQNMTGWIVELNRIDKGMPMVSDRENGVRRYQRNVGEQGRAEFWHSRESEIEISLAENQIQPFKRKSANKRSNVLRLISLRKLEALQYWNMGEYLESVRNESRWFFDLAIYEDEYGVYQGTAEYLLEAVISSVQSLDSEQFSEEEMQQLAAKMYYHYPEGYEKLVRFLTSNPQKCTWNYGIQWLKYLIMDFDSGQLSRILKWIVEEYDPFIQAQKHHFDLGEYDFLWQAAYQFSREDWNRVFSLIKRIFKNYFLYSPNQKLAKNSLKYMPLSLCEEALEMIEKWPSEQVKRNVAYESCIILSKRWGSEMKVRLHQFVHTCQKPDPCSMYQELDTLIDINNLLERQDIDIEGICRAAEAILEELKDKDLSGYDSRFLFSLKEKFTNQNWYLMPKEKVFAIVRGFCVLLENHKEISKGYFMDICELFSQIGRVAEKSVQREIAVFFIEKYILPGTANEVKDSLSGYMDGPWNTFHFDLFGSRKWEQDIFSVLVNCITEIPEQYHRNCIQWAWKCLEKDSGILYYYAVLLFSYYYFTDKTEIRMTAFCGFLYIRGRLEAKGKYFESQLRHVLLAWDNLEKANLWFGEKRFEQLVEQDLDYQEMFQKPIMALMKKSGSSEIRHWGEEKGMAAVKQH